MPGLGPVLKDTICDICRQRQATRVNIRSVHGNNIRINYCEECRPHVTLRFAYPGNNIPVTLPSGPILIRNVFRASGMGPGPSYTFYIETPTSDADPAQLAREAEELVSCWTGLPDRDMLTAVIVGICRTEACLQGREIPSHMFNVVLQEDGSWRAERIDTGHAPQA